MGRARLLILIAITSLISTPAIAAEPFTFKLRPRFPNKPLALKQKAEVKTFYLDGHKVTVWQYPKNLRRVLHDIQKRSSEILCDCGIFVQIQHLLSQRSPLNQLFPPAGNVAEFIACVCDTHLAYLHVSDLFAHDLLQRTSYHGKGSWLLPLDHDRYLGLTPTGPIIATKAEWKKRAKAILEDELAQDQFATLCGEALTPVQRDEMALVRTLIESGKHEHWEIQWISKDALPPQLARDLKEAIK